MSAKSGYPYPDTQDVVILREETLHVLRNGRWKGVHTDALIVLAAILFADEEGVAELHDGSLARWCTPKGQRERPEGFLEGRIEKLIAAGALAEGSTPEELRSMVSRRADVEDSQEDR